MDITPFQGAMEQAKQEASGWTDFLDYLFNTPNEKAPQAENAFQKIAAAIQKVGDQLYDTGVNMERFGHATENFFAPAAKLGQDAIDTAIEYESAFTGVKKTTKATEEEYAALSEGIKKMSTETASSKTEIAGVMETVGQLTDQVDALLPITETAIKLGDSTTMSAEDAATQLTRLMNIMGDGGDKATAYGSALVELGNNMATDEKSIMEMSLRIAGAGTTLGMTGDEVLALSAGLSSLGIKAQMGGSSISRVLLSMGEAAKTGLDPAADMLDKARDSLIEMRVAAAQKSGLEVTAEDFADMTVSMRDLQLMMENSPSDFRKLADAMGMTKSEVADLVDANVHLEEFAEISGMSAEEFAKAVEDDAYNALLTFLGGLGNLDEEGETAYSVLQGLDLNTIRVRDSLLRGAAGYEQMTKAADMASDAFVKQTALEEEAQLRYSTTETKVHQLKETFSNLLLEVGDKLIPLVEKALGFGEKIITFLDKLPDGMLETIATIGLVGSAIGKVITSIGGVVKAGGTIISMLGSLGPTGLLITGIVAAIALIIANWDKISEFFKNIYDKAVEIEANVQAWCDNVNAKIDAFVAGLTAGIESFIEGATAWFTNLQDKVNTGLDTVKNAIQTGLEPIGEFFGNAWEAAKTAVQKQLDDMVTAYESHDNKVEGILAAGWEFMTSGWDAAWTFIDELTGGKLSELAGALGDWISERIAAIAEFFSNLQEKVKSGLDAVKKFFTDALNTVKQTITTFITTIKNKFTEFFTNLKNKVEEFKRNLIEKFENLKTQAIEKIKTMLSNIVQNFKEFLTNPVQWGRQLIEGFINGIVEKWNALKSKVTNVVDTVKGFFTGSSGFDTHSPSKWAEKVFANVMQGGIEGLQDGLPAMLKAADGITSDVKDALTWGPSNAYGTPSVASMREPSWSAARGSQDGLMMTELRRTLESLKGMKVVMDTGETVGVLTAPMNNSLGTQYAYTRRGI